VSEDRSLDPNRGLSAGWKNNNNNNNKEFQILTLEVNIIHSEVEMVRASCSDSRNLSGRFGVTQRSRIEVFALGRVKTIHPEVWKQ